MGAGIEEAVALGAEGRPWRGVEIGGEAEGLEGRRREGRDVLERTPGSIGRRRAGAGAIDVQVPAGDRGGAAGRPGRARPAARQRSAIELGPLGRLQDHLAVVGLRDIGVGAGHSRTKVGTGGVDQREPGGRERPRVVGTERIAARVLDRARDRGLVGGGGQQVCVRVERRRVPGVADGRRYVAASALSAQTDAGGINRCRVQRLTEDGFHVGGSRDARRAPRRRPLDDGRCDRVTAGAVARAHLVEAGGQPLVARAERGAVLQVTRAASDRSS